MATENKEGFILYKSYYEPIKNLSFEEKGKLLDAIFQYQINPNNPVGLMGSNVKMAFDFFVNQFRLDEKKYQKTVNRNRANGLKGGRPKNPVGFQKPKKADKEKDKEKDYLQGFDADSSFTIEEAWTKYSSPYLKSLSISDPVFIENARQAYISKSSAASEKAVQRFIDTQKKYTPPDEADYVTGIWPEGTAEVKNG